MCTQNTLCPLPALVSSAACARDVHFHMHSSHQNCGFCVVHVWGQLPFVFFLSSLNPEFSMGEVFF